MSAGTPASVLKTPKNASNFGRRKFSVIPDQHPDEQPDETTAAAAQSDDERADLLRMVRRGVVGRGTAFMTAFGARRVFYGDYAASGRALTFIEEYIRYNVLPFYANTHTTTSVTSLQMTMFRQEARALIHSATNCSEYDAVLFCGSGCTGAVHQLIRALRFVPTETDAGDDGPPVVFTGPYEHHSNLLPWREIPGATVLTVRATAAGTVDLDHLAQLLLEHSSRPVKIGAFSAASNVTGILADTNAIAACLHRHGALALFDYAAAAPYTPIDMNPVVSGPDRDLVYKDAIFVATHKLIGAPATPGILIAKKRLFRSQTPSNCGGGTVFYVTEHSQRYLQDVVSREEGGTPDIVGAIRAGLAFKLKRTVGPQSILDLELSHSRTLLNRLNTHQNILLLGNHSESAPDRLCIVSFLLRAPNGLYLHHNFVCSLLNDLFGIQVRGGCACAGPYAQALMGMSEELAMRYETILLEDDRLDRTHLRRQHESSLVEALRPGFTRISLNYFTSDAECRFVADAVLWVAEHGWKMLPVYLLNPETGEWRHRDRQVFKDRRWLGSVSFTANGMQTREPTECADLSATPTRSQCFDCASDALESIVQLAQSGPSLPAFAMPENAELLRWFMYSHEAQLWLKSDQKVIKIPPFAPLKSSPNAVQEEDTAQEDDAPVDDQPIPSTELNITLNTPDQSDDLHIKKSSDRIRFHLPHKRDISGKMSNAILTFNMIQNGDRILICVSGGKDSLSLLHALHQFRFASRKRGIDFHIGCATVDPKNPLFDPSPLKQYMSALGVDYYYLEDDIMGHAAKVENLSSICSYCSRMKRGMLYKCARNNNYNVLAFGHHLDDLVETFMMSALHNGILFTMHANYTIKMGDLRVIRPLCYVREHHLREFALKAKLPIIWENCPACFESPKERHRIKQLIAHQELLFPSVFTSLQTALEPLMAIHTAHGRLGDPNDPSETTPDVNDSGKSAAGPSADDDDHALSDDECFGPGPAIACALRPKKK